MTKSAKNASLRINSTISDERVLGHLASKLRATPSAIQQPKPSNLSSFYSPSQTTQSLSLRSALESIDTLLTMQNPSGGFVSYKLQGGSKLLENLNAAEVFGRIIIEYKYPECTTAVVTALRLSFKHNPEYRRQEIDSIITKAVKYIRRAQRPDGSWYRSWGICFTYAGIFALESLASLGEYYANSANARHGYEFLVSKQQDDGGWGES
ncbi:MAG: hypothetical protein Q9217_006267 [Psora testacea]